jgi:tRNA-specific adenosine deaminase 3
VHQNTPSTSDPFAHLKRVRRDQSSSLTSVIIIPGSASPTHEPDALHAAPAPQLPPDLALSDPYIAHVPALPALTVSSLALKNVLWPTVYAPRRKNEPEVWTRGRVAWACDAVRTLVQLAAVSRASGNLPIAAYIPPPFIKEDALLNPLTVAVSGVDTRTETGHPLRHAVLAAVRALAAQRAHAESASGPGTANGSHYLLTSLTAFVTHEPCVMCAMALLHSRVKTVVYLAPMPGTGGCGGAACVPALEGVNHRFGIYKWSLEDENWAEWWERSGLEVADGVDA